MNLERIAITINAILFAAWLAVMASGCNATESQPTPVEIIAERDGVKVYRFRDNASLHYFVIDRDGHAVPVSGH